MDICDNQITIEKELYRRRGTEKNHSSGDKKKAEARSGSGSMLCQGGKGKSQPQVHQPSDKDVNSSVKTFTEKVLQEGKKT